MGSVTKETVVLWVLWRETSLEQVFETIIWNFYVANERRDGGSHLSRFGVEKHGSRNCGEFM